MEVSKYFAYMCIFLDLAAYSWGTFQENKEWSDFFFLIY